MDSFIQNAFDKTFGGSDQSSQSAQQSSEPAQQQQVDLNKIEEDFNVNLRQAKIVVVGCGGAGNNTVSTLTDMGIDGATTIAINTDAKHLGISNAQKKLLIGREATRGLGAGGWPEIGKKAAEESLQDIKKILEGADMVFVTCGLGGGTGTGTLPIVAEVAKNMGAIVIGTVTMPFKMEGTRIYKAEEGLKRLREVTDTVIVIENQKLLEYAGDLPVKQAFKVADELISTMIKGISETITQPSLVNLDYADVKTIMYSGGLAAIGIGESDSSNRAEEAVEKTLQHPLLEVDYKGAGGAVIQIIGGEDLKLDEINKIGERISGRLDPESQVIWGARVMPGYEGKIQVITIVTGVKSPYILGPTQKEQQTEKPKFSDELGIPMFK